MQTTWNETSKTIGRNFLNHNPCNWFSSGPEYTQLSPKQTNKDMKLVITGGIKSKWLIARADMRIHVCFVRFYV